MPIDYKEYHPKWHLISRLIRYHRAKNRCEWCGAPNGEIIARGAKGTQFENTYMVDEGYVYDANNGKYLGRYKGSDYLEDRFTKVVLTVAHLDHDKTNNRFWNLAALCQKCHLGYDLHRHIRKRKYGEGEGQMKINFNDL